MAKPKKNIYIGVLALLALSLLAHAGPPEDWEKRYKELKSYDNYAHTLRDDDGSWIKPKKDIVGLLKTLKPEINAAANKLGVDPRAIAGSILAENTLNVSVSDKAQDWLVKNGLASKGKVLGKSFTFGIGQLHYDSARQAEDYMAKIEKRKPLTQAELEAALLDPEKAVYQVGAVLRFVQDTYKEQGYDISKDVGVLTTLYNLGKSESKAKALKEKGGKPRVNYFGFFNEKYMADIETVVGKPAAPAPVAPVVAVAPKTSAKVGSLSEKPKKGKVADKPKSAASNDKSSARVSGVNTAEKTSEVRVTKTKSAPAGPKKVLQTVLIKDLVLYQAPPECPGSRYNGPSATREKYKSLTHFGSSGVIQAGMSYKELAPTIDCETNAWVLIKDPQGLAGWVKKSDLEGSSEKKLAEDVPCDPKGAEACSKSVSEATKEYQIPVVADEADVRSPSLVFLKPVAQNSQKISFKNSDWSCGYNPDQDDRALIPNQANQSVGMQSGGIGMGMPAPTATGPNSWLSNQAANAIRYKEDSNYHGYGYGSGNGKGKKDKPENSTKDLKGFRNALEKKFDELQIYNSKSPYSLATDLKEFYNNYKFCIEAQIAGNSFCNVELKAARKALGSIKASKHPTLAEVDQAGDAFENISLIYSPRYSSFDFNSGTQFNSTPEEIATFSKDEAADALLKCSVQMEKWLAPTAAELKAAAKSGARQYYSSKVSERYREQYETVSKLTDEQWQAAAPLFVRTIRICSDSLDLIGSREKVTPPTVATCEIVSKSVFRSREFSRDVLKSLVKDDSRARVEYVTGELDRALDAGLLDRIKQMNNPAPSTASTGAPKRLGRTSDDTWGGGSYCPNRTAEYVEELLKNNPCINHVYVPDKWLLNRLNELGGKIIYRPFLADDRYAIDVAQKECR